MSIFEKETQENGFFSNIPYEGRFCGGSLFWYRAKCFIKTFLAVATALALAFVVGAMNLSRFSVVVVGGKFGQACIAEKSDGIFYLYSPSSQGARKEKLNLRDIPCIRGESVAFEITFQNASARIDIDETAFALADSLSAEILFIEEILGVKSYYCYTEKWLDGVWINGKKINLHIAFRMGEIEESQEASTQNSKKISGIMGSPIIFDGY